MRLDKNLKYPQNLLVQVFRTDELNELMDNRPADFDGTLAYVLSRFSERRQRAIEARFKEYKTFREVGEVLGVTTERARTIINSTTRKMCHPRCRAVLKSGLAEHIASIRAALAVEQASKEEASNELKNPRDIVVEELEFSVRAFNCLKRAGLNTVGDILDNGEALFKVQNCGKRTVEEVELKLHSLGYDIKLPRAEET